MPNLINYLKPSEVLTTENVQTEAGRRKELEQLLEGMKSKKSRGMEWGTCMIFSCAKDCCINEAAEFKMDEHWKEEFVLVQWDN